MENILWLREIGHDNVALVGGKAASLGEMYRNLTGKGVNVPNGFVCTTNVFRRIFSENEGLNEYIDDVMTSAVDKLANPAELKVVGKCIRERILSTTVPDDIVREIEVAYGSLLIKNVAVRSSSVFEDGVENSFAGMYDTFLNINSTQSVINSVLKCFASIYNDRAIAYKISSGTGGVIDDTCLAVVVQEMVRSDLASSGVMFTADVESGFRDVIVVNAAYGLCELVVQGELIVPDEFVIFKPTFIRESGNAPVIEKKLGQKTHKMVYQHNTDSVEVVDTTEVEKSTFSLTEYDLYKLTTWAFDVKGHYSKIYGELQEYDMEFAKDGVTGQLFLVQVRPLTTLKTDSGGVCIKKQTLEYIPREPPVVVGISVGSQISSGKVVVLKTLDECENTSFNIGDILVTQYTSPDWEPIMKLAGGIITDFGGRTSHASIICREWGKCCLVAAKTATSSLITGDFVTIDTSSGEIGKVYRGKLPYTEQSLVLSKHRVDGCSGKIMMNLASPELAFKYHRYPTAGIGLLRVEFIINQIIGVHPNAILYPEKITDPKVEAGIELRTAGYNTAIDYYVETFARGIAKIAASVFPNDCIVRLSDFKSNEYSNLLGGRGFEPNEENPMLGFRGAARYSSPEFAEAFRLECRGILFARDVLGLNNIQVMIPFVRTISDLKSVLTILSEQGLSRSEKLKIGMMCEVPSNVILVEEFCTLVDFFSIGSNDLTQLTLGIDRDSKHLVEMFDENNEAVRRSISKVIRTCRSLGTKVGICGDAPSTHESFFNFLMEEGIDTISISPDAVVKFMSSPVS